MRQELEKRNNTCLEQVLQALDYEEEKMGSAANHFSGTQMAGQLEDVRNQKTDIDEGMVLSQLYTYATIVAEEERMPQMLLYLRGDRYIYTLDGRMEYQDFEKEMLRYGDLNQVSFFKTIFSNSKERTLRVGGDGKEDNSITWFLYPIPYMNNIPVATLGFGYETKLLEEMVERYYPLESAVFFLDRQRDIIYAEIPDSFGKEDTEASKQIAVRSAKSIGYMNTENIDGHKYIVMHEISANSGFAVVSVTKPGEFYQSDDSFARWFFLGVLVLAVGGIILALALSKSSYEPIQELMAKNEELNALVSRQRPMVVASCLKGLLKGQFKDRQEMEATLKSAAIRLDYKYHFVILLSISVEEDFESSKSIQILSALSTGLLPHLHMYGLDMLKDDGIAVIVNCQERERAGKDTRITVAECLHRKLKTEYGMELPFFVGRIYEDPMNISRSFIETTVLAGDYRMPGSQKIILFEEIGRDEPNMQYPVLEQAVYIQCLKQANREEALRALNNMIQEIEPLKSFVITQCLCFDIINVTIKTLDQMKGFELADVDFKKICTFTNLAEFREKAEVLVSEICRQYAQYKDNQNNTLKAGVLDYVNQHFGESGMGLEIVAGKFGVSANFMSRFFKQETGCSFIQYITMIRMDCAKELLINSDMQIKDIVAQIGYIDVANFVRKFKTYEGVTPGQYREKMRRQV